MNLVVARTTVPEKGTQDLEPSIRAQGIFGCRARQYTGRLRENLSSSQVSKRCKFCRNCSILYIIL